MQHHHGPEAIDHTIQDLFNNSETFGGITMLFVGDFCQTLPVVPRGSRAQIINASLRRSKLWRDVEICHLTQNMCLDHTPESKAFAEWLLKVGSGSNLTPEQTIKLYPEMCLPQNDIQGLVDAIYPDINQGNRPDTFFLKCTILSSKNDTVNQIIQMVLDRFPGEETVVISADKVNGHNSDTYPKEFLNSLIISGFSLAHLALKPGCPLMLLCNIDLINSLCNGTHMVLLEIRPRVLKCCILGGDHAGKEVFIPRITLDPSEDNLPINITHRQFPVHLAFAMTINKSQGQSIMNVGIDLHTPVFAHGQLYVALSHCTSKDRIKVLFPELSDTTNIVYPEVIAGLIVNKLFYFFSSSQKTLGQAHVNLNELPGGVGPINNLKYTPVIALNIMSVATPRVISLF
jgi:ATP-dependent DNA helicase PIF1